jgi:hypothetical protein
MEVFVKRSREAILVAIGSVFLSTAMAQSQAVDADTQSPAPQAPAAAAASAPPAAPAAKSPFTQYGMDFSFLFDGYTDANFNHPDSGFNQLRNFDVRANSLHVSQVMATIDRAPAPVGFHLEAGFGQTFHMVHFAERFPDEADYIKQFYVSFKPKSWKGLQVDVGKFVTSAGAEVIESNANWNYSRSILFAWAIPYYHFGIRTAFPVGEHFTGGVQLVNGWNNVKDNNTGKTLGLTGAYAWKKVTWSNNYYAGPEKDHTNQGWRQVYDTTALINATDKLSTYINFDYGREALLGGELVKWAGIAGAARYAITSKAAIAGRTEFFNDIDGFSTGVQQKLSEVTVTGEYKLANWLLSRLEFRSDFSNQPFFEKEHGQSVKSQPTVLFALVAFFGPKK